MTPSVRGMDDGPADEPSQTHQQQRDGTRCRPGGRMKYCVFFLLTTFSAGLKPDVPTSASSQCVKMSNNSPEGFSLQTCLWMMMKFYIYFE